MSALALHGVHAQARKEPKVAAQKANGSGIDLGFTEAVATQAGVPIALPLTFDGVTDPAGGQVRLSTDAGLTLSGDATFTLAAGKVERRSVTVKADAEGFFYLNVFTTQSGRTSVSSIPVKVGKAVPALTSLGKITQSGREKLVVMPVP